MVRFLTRKKDGRVFSLDRGNPKSDINPTVIVKSGFRRIRITKETPKEDIKKFLGIDNKKISRAKQSPKFKALPKKEKKAINIFLGKLKTVKNKKSLVKLLKKNKEIIGSIAGIGLIGVLFNPALILLAAGVLGGFFLGLKGVSQLIKESKR